MAITVKPFMAQPVDYIGEAIVTIELPNGGILQINIHGEDMIEICNTRTLSHELLVKPSANNLVYIRLQKEV